jgi:hypothetical protein
VKTLQDEDEESNNSSVYDFDYNNSAASVEGDGDDAVYYTTSTNDDRGAAGPLVAESVFDRRERLDVKKPGPFFTNSQNNFFLDKVNNYKKEKCIEKDPPPLHPHKQS